MQPSEPPRHPLGEQPGRPAERAALNLGKVPFLCALASLREPILEQATVWRTGEQPKRPARASGHGWLPERDIWPSSPARRTSEQPSAPPLNTMYPRTAARRQDVPLKCRQRHLAMDHARSHHAKTGVLPWRPRWHPPAKRLARHFNPASCRSAAARPGFVSASPPGAQPSRAARRAARAARSLGKVPFLCVFASLREPIQEQATVLRTGEQPKRPARASRHGWPLSTTGCATQLRPLTAPTEPSTALTILAVWTTIGKPSTTM